MVDVHDQYQESDGTKIIQHVTVENFGHYDGETGELHWQPDGNAADAGNDPALIKLAQECLIRKDIAASHLLSVKSELIEIASALTFYRFEYMHENPDHEVMVVRMQLSGKGAIAFEKKQVNLNHLEDDDQMTRLCRGVLQMLYGNKKAGVWDRVDCVVEAGNHQLVIQALERSTMPDGKRILTKLIKSDLDRQYTCEQISIGLNQVRPYISGASAAALAQVQRSLNQMPRVFPLKTLAEALKKVGLSPRSAGMRQLNELLEAHAEFAFKNTLQRKMPNSPMAGMKGMGMVRVGKEWQYFIGANMSLKQTIHRSALLRRLHPLQGNDETVMSLFPRLEKLMSVEFVRSGQYTVVPFPVKYLREYWAMQLRQHPEYRRPIKKH